ncbi:MAG: hypothetical protein ACI88H_001840, partial [Cocleimonas sp.]
TINAKGKNIFCFNPADYQQSFAENGYVLIKNGLDANFLDTAIEQAEKQRIDQQEINNCFFKGKKRQYLYEFEEWDFYNSGLESLAKTANLPLDKATLCERHIKVYEPDAKPNVPAHKDRIAAQVTVGIPLLIPEGSHIVLWPEDHLEINALNTTALWRTNLDEENLPQNILKDIEPVRIFAEPGDVVMFRGNSIHHERENPANARILYLKLNGMRLDPMGEDPSTLSEQETSQQILAQLDDQKLLDCIVEVSPRLEKISRHYTRLYWTEVIQAYVADEKEFTVSELELEVFKKAEDQKTVREVISRLGIPEPEHINHVPMIRRLAKLKGLNIIAPEF